MKSAIALLTFLLGSISFGQSWQDVGGGTNNSSHGMLVWDGKLVNLGSFNSPCNRVAVWDGSNWSCLGAGVGIVARAGTVWNGNLVVVGDFWNVQQPCVGCNGIAMWDGTQWTNLGTGFNNDVLTVGVFNGDLIAAGDFSTADGLPCNRIARWTGTNWVPMGGPADFDNDIRCMAEFNGEFYVGGDFNNVGGNSPSDGLVKWDPNTSSWVGGNSGVDLVGGVNETVRVLFVNPNDGNLYMGGEFPELHDGDAPSPDYNMSGVAMYDGSNWYPLGTGLNEYCRAIHEYNGDLIVGGYFTTAGGVPANKIAKWNTTTNTWSAMGLGFDASGIDEYVKSATNWNGIFFAGGAYTQAEGNPMNYIAQWYEAPTNPPVSVINASNSTVCEGGCIQFSDNSTNSPTTWNWSFPGATIPSSTSQSPGSICYPTAGNYTAQLIVCNSNGCDTSNLNITIGAAPTITVNSASICEGESVTLTATPSSTGGSFLWGPGGETSNSITVAPSSSASYTVSYTLNGCTSTTQTSQVTVNPTPTVSVNSASICQGDSITISSTPSITGGTYVWNPGGSSTSSITVSPASTTNYDLVYTLNGCPSNTATVTITVHPVFNGSNSISVCTGTNVTYPDGSSEIVNSATSHISYLNSAFGCDSVITTTVTTFPDYSLNETVTVCSGSNYTYPDGTVSTSIFTNESHTSTLVSAEGCDSIVTTLLTVVNSYTETANIQLCAGESYTYPDGTVSTNVVTNESHVSQLLSSGGCDSIITTNLTILPVYNSNETHSVCAGTVYTFPDGSSQTINANTNHTSVLSSVNGCDSIIVTTLHLLDTYSETVSVSVCAGEDFTFPDGTSVSNVQVDQNHTSNLSTGAGCDSVITTFLNVLPMPSTLVTENNLVLEAAQNGAQYQWMDCQNNYAFITGATQQSFAPTANGNYAVEINLGGCVDTSACQLIATMNVDELTPYHLHVFPNPVGEQLELQSNRPLIHLSYILLDARGRIVQSGTFDKEDQTIHVSHLEEGSYTLVIDETVRVKFIKL